MPLLPVVQLQQPRQFALAKASGTRMPALLPAQPCHLQQLTLLGASGTELPVPSTAQPQCLQQFAFAGASGIGMPLPSAVHAWHPHHFILAGASGAGMPLPPVVHPQQPRRLVYVGTSGTRMLMSSAVRPQQPQRLTLTGASGTGMSVPPTVHLQHPQQPALTGALAFTSQPVSARAGRSITLLVGRDDWMDDCLAIILTLAPCFGGSGFHQYRVHFASEAMTRLQQFNGDTYWDVLCNNHLTHPHDINLFTDAAPSAASSAESVRLVNGTSLCSGTLEVKSNQSIQSWSSVCEDNFGQQDAEVVCRELGCGPAAVLQGVHYEDEEAPVWSKDFQCEGHESAVLDCRISGSDRKTCSSHNAVGLTCSEPDDFLLYGGSSPCAGELEVKLQGEWMDVDGEMSSWNLQAADEVCRQLNCGAAVSTGKKRKSYYKSIAWIRSTCLQWKSAVRECVLTKSSTSIDNIEIKCSEPSDFLLVRGSSLCAGELEMQLEGKWRKVDYTMSPWNLKTADSARECVSIKSDTSHFNLKIQCSESVRLVNGTSLCSGRLEVKSNQRWSLVCEDDFDQQDAEVVCKELGCGAPLAFKGGLYGDKEGPVWSKEFQCEGQESALLDCAGSSSARENCSPGRAVGLTCSEPDDIRLVEGASHCDGRLEMRNKGDWRPVTDDPYNWDLISAAVVCKQLDCGSVLSTGREDSMFQPHAWKISSSCGHSESAIRECAVIWSYPSTRSLVVNCSESVRLVNGASLCSGRLEVKSNQRWSPVCEDDFDQQDAEVVCRELGCGAPSVLQGAVYEEVEAPVWSKEFHCEGHESALLDCRSSDRNTCSSGKAVGFTCSEPNIIRLSGGTSRCDGTLEMEHQGEWRPVANQVPEWDQKFASAVCGQLNCGSAVITKGRHLPDNFRPWHISHSCVQAGLILRECVFQQDFWAFYLEVICSGFPDQPVIFPSHIDGLYEAEQQRVQVLMGSDFTISCFILPQYQGGSFQLSLTNSATPKNYTLTAVNHSAHFLFSAADHTHRGEYRCVYHIYAFSHNFSSESQLLYLTVGASVTHLIIRVFVLLGLALVSGAVLYLYFKNTSGQKPKQEDSFKLDFVGGAQDLLGEGSGGAQGPE
ncbi:scavenger receptor cysteine-rich type 1 protein M130-like [Plectropomus leopardus]|uniref:scavenger receptor cysteine-rich type 1 protein M130-like n=1 Tax=Plectropomus leopardus TaxID=160734 RepID=UPI001C4AC0F7|nr:scavenger receptor cysteine-rich type 1 protein M130-like [Plectropomus leopardus]